ncbi:FAD/NAD(P)-binding domain-containing protein [Roridomyces roridus]|uniref:FAD/NAD(P)-binding domain-containing protein n=1 Tax=Roridomyces roridus TaxID=1738132 RepID=A0AAD7F8I8_9AGAR|nr:FAD/NAD(P)-binding domain-containing protein [Roridomyces roridus]
MSMPNSDPPPLPPSIEVCIVGAGPSGLACALGLAARQVPFVIVDGLAEGQTTSRAIVVFPGTLEAVGALHPQVAEDIMATGVCGNSLRAFDRHGQPVFHIPLTNLKTNYPFGMFMGQHTVEEAMRAGVYRSGSTIHFGKRMEAIKEVDGGAQYELLFESGEKLRARYVVAADGAKSFLRSFAGITFRDPYTKKEAVPGPGDSNFVVADIVYEKPTDNVTRDGLQLNIGDDGFVLTGPMKDAVDPERHLFRLYVGMTGTPPRNPDLAFLQGILDKRGPGSQMTPPNVPRIAKVLHAARFRTRPALADSYLHKTKGGAYILLAGDAAHTHGPAGGQGMNLGICDGSALALAIDRHRTASLMKEDAGHILESYAKTRREVGFGVIDMVQFMSKLEAGGLSWAQWFRVVALRIFSPVPFVSNLLAWSVSGLGTATKA